MRVFTNPRKSHNFFENCSQSIHQKWVDKKEGGGKIPPPPVIMYEFIVSEEQKCYYSIQDFNESQERNLLKKEINEWTVFIHEAFIKKYILSFVYFIKNVN